MENKRVFNCLLTLFTVFVLLLNCVGCNSDEDGSSRKKKSNKSSEIQISDKVDPSGEKEKRFRMSAVSKLKAETVDYYYSKDMNYTCFFACVDGRYGTMDDKGIMIADPIFEKPYFSMAYYCESEKPDVSIFKWVLWCNNGEEIIVFNKDGGLIACQQIPTGFVGTASVYWMSGKPVMAVDNMEPGTSECSFEAYYDNETYLFKNAAYMNYPGAEKSKIIPIREVTSFTKVDNMESEEYEPVYKSEKYGLFSFDTNKMITGFIYDECKGPIDGVFAVRKGNKWGYVTESGKKLTDLVYDVANVHVDEYDAQYNYNEMYLPVNGYIVTVKNGKYGMIDTLGKTVLENRYGYISQVSGNGVFFMLDGDVWSRCVMK